MHVFHHHAIEFIKRFKPQKRKQATNFTGYVPPSTRHTVNSLEPDIFEQIKWCADHGVSVCMPHRDFTDKHLDKENRVIHDLESILTAIRDAGMITGLSCHYHEVIRVVEERKYDVPLIIQPFNQKGFESDTNPAALEKIIQGTNIQILSIKPLAAARIKPRPGIEFVLSKIKPNDFMTCGFDQFKHMIEDIKIIDELMNK